MNEFIILIHVSQLLFLHTISTSLTIHTDCDSLHCIVTLLASYGELYQQRQTGGDDINNDTKDDKDNDETIILQSLIELTSMEVFNSKI